MFYKAVHRVEDLLYFLQGKKTYIVTTVGGLFNLWLMVNPSALTASQVLKVNAVLVFLGGAALRAAVTKV
jgi:hypothetical protein